MSVTTPITAEEERQLLRRTAVYDPKSVLERYADPYFFTGDLARMLRNQTDRLRGLFDKLLERKGKPQYEGDAQAQALLRYRLMEQVVAIDVLLLISAKYCEGVVADGVNACEYGQYTCEAGRYGICVCGLPGAEAKQEELPYSGEYVRTTEICRTTGSALNRFLDDARELGYIIEGRTFFTPKDKQQVLSLRPSLEALKASVQRLIG